MTRPTWTLITVTFDSADDLRAHWSGLPLGDDVEWVVVDNVSKDDSSEIALELGARLIRAPRNLGFGAANNYGFSRSASEFVAFVNPDVTPRIADLDRLAAVLRANPNALVSPQLINMDGSPQPNGRGKPYLSNKVINRITPHRLDGEYRLFAASSELLRVDWLMGAMVAGNRSWLDSLGPWDPHFFVYYEDADLGLRNTLAGGVSYVIGDLRWMHGWARATSKPSWRAWRRELPSMVKFYTRYPGLIANWSRPARARTFQT